MVEHRMPLPLIQMRHLASPNDPSYWDQIKSGSVARICFGSSRHDLLEPLQILWVPPQTIPVGAEPSCKRRITREVSKLPLPSTMLSGLIFQPFLQHPTNPALPPQTVFLFAASRRPFCSPNSRYASSYSGNYISTTAAGMPRSSKDYSTKTPRN